MTRVRVEVVLAVVFAVLAVVTAIVTAVASAPSGENGAPPQRGRWNDPAGGVRRPLLPGPGAWRATAR